MLSPPFPSSLLPSGVLTKVDIMDRGTDCRDVLLGQTMRLKHGWVAVVNRGQADINTKVSMGDARSKEMDYFRGHSSYKDLENIGTPYLSKKLSNHLINEILKQLPSIQAFIDNRYACASDCMGKLAGQYSTPQVLAIPCSAVVWAKVPM